MPIQILYVKKFIQEWPGLMAKILSILRKTLIIPTINIQERVDNFFRKLFQGNDTFT